MIWNPLNDEMLATQSADFAIADWLANSGGDGFGLPLVGTLLGFQSPQQTMYDYLMDHDLSHLDR